jgi:hypothetical protein
MAVAASGAGELFAPQPAIKRTTIIARIGACSLRRALAVKTQDWVSEPVMRLLVERGGRE